MENLIYLYSLIPAEAQKTIPELTGFDGEGKLYPVSINENVTAVVCQLDPEVYAEEKIEDKINNDMDWLKEKAFHHHETITALYKDHTIIPLKFCTIYKGEESLREKIQENEDKVESSFDLLKDNEEWNVKIFADDEALKKQVSDNNEAIEEKRQEISRLSRGKQFFERKKIDDLIDKELDKEKDRVGDMVHDKLKQYAIHDAIKKNWNKDVTGLQENMVWNSVYLLPEEVVASFLREVKQFENELGELGWRLEASGPWPSYHFSSFS
ncbi:GvpL/GvpF family gas vesicle protein [Virgibacillus sp. NKC19-16]|uniref:GvpL/GvpF family gas vesicle protein n=1 Tax=Virgibacillus salidurans TaxID=2831673 RepID=UPI001F418EC2|nr:GvpL/GvpF family gas vesicle protein [Virgibacillus sp. NKC19-16]UJL47064.1 GvpL/GvpF family gas vesicle protein [Virgibacillus sp. NKC19-16]